MRRSSLPPTLRVIKVGLALAVMVGFAAPSCGPAPFKPPTMDAVPVRTAKATSQDVPVIHRYPTVFQSPRPVQLTARVAGYLLPQVTPDGATVKAGDVVYRIDPAQYLAQLAGAEAALASAIAARDFAVSEVERNQPLVVAGAMSQQNFDNLRTKAAEAEAQVLSAAAQVEIQKLNVSYCTIVAPLAGKLGKSLEYEGSMVGPGYATDLNLVVQTDPMWAQFSPSATEWPHYEKLLSAGPLEATVQYGSSSALAKGRVIFTNNEVGQTTSAQLMRVEFPNPQGIFIQGAMGEVMVQLQTLNGAVVIPAAALWARETQLFVWKVQGDQTVTAVRVETGVRLGTDVVITSGLAAGDTVVTAGGQKLREGGKVTEATSTTTGAPSTGAAPRPAPHSDAAPTANTAKDQSR